MRLRDLLPALLVVVLALTGSQQHEPDVCEPSDGPQFRCWLDDR